MLRFFNEVTLMDLMKDMQGVDVTEDDARERV